LAVGYLFGGQIVDALRYAQRLGSGVLLLLAGLLLWWVLWKIHPATAIPKET
jgi:predicted MFS family arabinose efflux permease